MLSRALQLQGQSASSLILRNSSAPSSSSGFFARFQILSAGNTSCTLVARLGTAAVQGRVKITVTSSCPRNYGLDASATCVRCGVGAYSLGGPQACGVCPDSVVCT